MTSRRTHGPPEDLLDDWGQLRVPVVFPPKRDSYAVVEPSLEAWEELGNDRDRGDSSRALKQRLSQLAAL